MMRYLPTTIACILLLTLIASAQDSAPSLLRLTNNEILEMVRADISPDVIVAKIRTSHCNFNTEPTILAELRHKGVPNAVLKAMIEAPYGPPRAEPTPPEIPIRATLKAAEGSKAEPPDETELIAARSAVKALRKLKSASEVGVSYVNYGPLVVEAKTEVDDAITRIPEGALRTAIVKSMRQYELASEVWHRYWRSDFVDGEYKDLAVKQYGVKKKGLLRVVWRSDFVRAIWNEASNQFAVAERLTDTGPNTVGRTRHLLTGAWTISVKGEESIDFTLTVEPNGSAVMRTPQGNAVATITCNQLKCLISASDTYEKRLVTIRLDATVNALTHQADGSKVADALAGVADIDDGKRKGAFPFTASRLGR